MLLIKATEWESISGFDTGKKSQHKMTMVCRICSVLKQPLVWGALFSVTGFSLFQVMLVMLHPLVSSQLKAQRRFRVGDEELSSPSSLCSSAPGFTVLSGSYTINITAL